MTTGLLIALALALAQFTPTSPFVSVKQVVAQQAAGAILTLLNPPVEVAVAGGAFAAGRSGQALQPGDAVRTGDGGVALVTFLDGSETQLTPGTQLMVTAATRSGGVSLTQVVGTTVNRVQQLTGGATFNTDTPTAAAIVRGTRYVVTVKTLPISQPQRVVFPRLLAKSSDLLVGDAVYLDAGGRWNVRAWQNTESGEVYDTFERLGDAYPEVGVALFEDETGDLWRTRTLLDPETGEAFDTYEELGRAVDTLPMPDQSSAGLRAAPFDQALTGSITTGVVVEGRVGLVPKRAGQAGVELTPGQAGAVTNGASAQSPLTQQGFQLFDQSTRDLHDVQAALTTAALADQVVAEFAATLGFVPPPASPPPGPPPGGGGGPGGAGGGGGGGGPTLAGATLLGGARLILDQPEVAGVTAASGAPGPAAGAGGATSNAGTPPATSGGPPPAQPQQAAAGGGGGGFAQSAPIVPTHTNTPVRSSGSSPTDTPTPTPTLVTGVATPTDTPTPTATPTGTPASSTTPTATATPTSTSTVSPTATPTSTPGTGGSCTAGNTAAVFWTGGSGAWGDPTNWSTGTVPGASNDVCITNPAVTVTFAQGTSTVLSLHNQASLVLSGGSLTIRASGQSEAGNLSFTGGSLSAAGAIVVQDGQTCTWTGGTLSGAGTVRLDSGAGLLLGGTGDRVLTDATVDNSGAITWIDGGRLIINGTGLLKNEAGALVDLQSTATIFSTNGSPSVVNLGTLRKSTDPGLATISVPITNSGAVTTNAGTLDLTGGGTLNSGATFNGTAATQLNSGTFTVNGTVTATNLNLASGIVTGPGTLEVPAGSTLTWTGGQMSGTGGTTHITGTLLLSGQGDRTLTDRTLDNANNIIWTTGGRLIINGTGTLRNEAGALVDLQSTATIFSTNGSPSIVNLGTLRKSVNIGLATIGVRVVNSGTVTTNTGTLDLTGGGTFNSGATFNGTATTLLDTGTFNVNGSAIATNVTLASGAVSGSGTLEVPAGSTLTWTGGTMSGVDGTTHISGTLLLSGQGDRTLTDRTLDNANNITWTTGGRLIINGTGTLKNEAGASLDLQSTATIFTTNGSPSILNLGTLRKSVNTGLATISVPLTNSGTVTTNAGTLDLDGATGTFNDGAAFNGTATTQLDSGVFTVNGIVTAMNVTLASGVVTGTGTLDVPAGSTLTWTGGTMSGAGGTTHISGSALGAPGRLLLSGQGDRTLIDRTLDNLGAILWTDGGRLIANGKSQIVNEAAATMTLQTDGEIFSTNGTPSMQNAGTIGKTAGTGTALLGITLTNQQGGTIVASSGRFDFATLVNSGGLSPTAGPGKSNVNGTYTQTSTGSLNLKLGPATGTCAQATSDTLAITGATTLDGTLNVASQGCTANTPITMLTFPSLIGRFAMTNLPPADVVRYVPTNAPTSVVVNVG